MPAKLAYKPSPLNPHQKQATATKQPTIRERIEALGMQAKQASAGIDAQGKELERRGVKTGTCGSWGGTGERREVEDDDEEMEGDAVDRKGDEKDGEVGEKIEDENDGNVGEQEEWIVVGK